MPHSAEYLCPICRLSLQKQANSYTCQNAHNFDIAKQGYVNLLPVQQKKTKNPGDNKLMIKARQAFLEKAYYDFLIEPCIQLIQKHCKENAKLLDIGCGEGYFTQHVFRKINYHLAYGFDISKEALKIAAKRDSNIYWFVASSKEIPLEQNSLDAILKINIPTRLENISPYLTEKGIIISVTPGENHLHGLKELIYKEPKKHQAEPPIDGHVIIDQTLVENALSLDNNQDIKNLLFMTPYAWNIPKTVQQVIEGLDTLETSIAFQINVWQKQ